MNRWRLAFLHVLRFLLVRFVWFLVQPSVWTFVSFAIVFSCVFWSSLQQQSHVASARVRVPTERKGLTSCSTHMLCTIVVEQEMLFRNGARLGSAHTRGPIKFDVVRWASGVCMSLYCAVGTLVVSTLPPLFLSPSLFPLFSPHLHSTWRPLLYGVMWQTRPGRVESGFIKY